MIIKFPNWLFFPPNRMSYNFLFSLQNLSLFIYYVLSRLFAKNIFTLALLTKELLQPRYVFVKHQINTCASKGVLQ